MAGAVQHEIMDLDHRGRAFWLPPSGWGNGLDDSAWAAVVDVRSEEVARVILAELRRAGVPGYAASVRPCRSASSDPRSRGRCIRIWLGCTAFGRGEGVVLRVLPQLAARFGGPVLAGT